MRSVLLGVLAALAAVALVATPALANVTIAEVLADPPEDPAGDVNRDGTRSPTEDEFVELINSGAKPMDLSSWSLSDATKVRHTFAAGTILAPSEAIVVFSGGQPQGFKTPVVTASSGSLSLNNTGDVLTLRDAAMDVMDSLSYGSAGDKDQSLVRNGEGEFVLHSSLEGANGALFSPGAVTKQ